MSCSLVKRLAGINFIQVMMKEKLTIVAEEKNDICESQRRVIHT